MEARLPQILFGLNLQQSLFVREYLRHGDEDQAATDAGYTGTEAGWRLIRLPTIHSAIRNEISRRINTEGASIGYRVLVELSKDVTAPPAVRRACARDLMAIAGHQAPKAIEAATGSTKPLHEMTSDELRGVVDRLECELAARATPVNAPTDALLEAKPLNWLD